MGATESNMPWEVGLNSSDIKMVPQYCYHGSAGVPAVPATISMSGLNSVL